MTQIFTFRTCLSEEKTIPQVVFEYAKKVHSATFTFDRGVGKREMFRKLSEQGTSFLTRI